MKIFFWDFQDDNDIARQWLMFAINSCVLAFTIVALYRTWRYYRQCMFEMMPLSINLIATFILLMLKLFQKGYQFDEIGHLIEIFTYFLFCYTFAIMYTLISKPDLKKKVQKFWNIALLVLFILLIATSILVFTGTISKKCEKDSEMWPAIVSLIIQSLSFIPTAYYGIRILNKMMKKEQNNEKDLAGMGSFASQIYIKQRKKQIMIVLSTYLLSLIIRFILSIIVVFFWDDLFQCTRVESVSIITSDFISGQIVLVLAQINELLPHVVIPIAMYVVPLQKMERIKLISLADELIDGDEDDEHSQEQSVQNRVSSLLTSRLSEDGSSPLKGSPKIRYRPPNEE